MSEEWDYVASNRTQVARKLYRCEAYDDLAEVIDYKGVGVLTWVQRELWDRIGVGTRAIAPGDQYRRVKGVIDGAWHTFRARLDVLYLLDAIERWELQVYRAGAADREAARVRREHRCVLARPDLYSAGRCAEASRALAKYAAERLAARPVVRSRS